VTADEGGIKSEPFQTIVEAQDWANKQLINIKHKIESYRKSLV
jgi:hypothetical protein